MDILQRANWNIQFIAPDYLPIPIPSSFQAELAGRIQGFLCENCKDHIAYALAFVDTAINTFYQNGNLQFYRTAELWEGELKKIAEKEPRIFDKFRIAKYNQILGQLGAAVNNIFTVATNIDGMARFNVDPAAFQTPLQAQDNSKVISASVPNYQYPAIEYPLRASSQGLLEKPRCAEKFKGPLCLVREDFPAPKKSAASHTQQPKSPQPHSPASNFWAKHAAGPSNPASRKGDGSTSLQALHWILDDSSLVGLIWQ